MRKLIAGLVAGLVLGTAGTAIGAVTGGYWAQPNGLYSCSGISTYAVCKSGGFSVGVTDEFVFVQKGKPGGHGPLFTCNRWSSWASCLGN
jgi:hypothetical protein